MGIDELRREAQAYKAKKLKQEVDTLHADVTQALEEFDEFIVWAYDMTMGFVRMAAIRKHLTPMAMVMVQMTIDLIVMRNDAVEELEKLEKY